MISLLKIKYLVIFSLLMIQSLVSGSDLSTFLVYLIILVLLVASIVSISYFLEGKYRFVYSGADLLVGLFVIALARSFLNGTLGLNGALFYLLVLILFPLILRFDVQRSSFWKSIVGAFILILIINICFYGIGIDGAFWNERGFVQTIRAPQNVRILSFFNVDVVKEGFFIFNSYAYYSILLGILIIVITDRKTKLKKFFPVLLCSLAFLSMVVLDARSPLLFLVIVAALSKFILKINQDNFYLFFILVSITPFVYSGVMFYFGFSDSDSTKIVSSRDLIWSSFFTYYNPDIFELFFGHGFLGQRVSGISANYEYLFLDRGRSSLIISLHNNYLQYLMDVGLVGIFVLYKVTQKTIMKIDKLNYKVFKPIILYLLLIGVSEMGIIINNLIAFYFFIAIVYFLDYRYYKMNSIGPLEGEPS